MTLTELDKAYIANTYARFPLELVSGKGAQLKSSDGKEYIDLGSGIAVNIFGIADDEWVKAVTTQAATLAHTSNLYYTEPCAKLASLLCEKTGMKKVFFSNSGAEANECAIKAARQYAINKKGKEYYNIITLVNSFHGRTITTLAATGQEVFHNHFTPLTEGFIYVEANNIQALRKAVEDNKCAAIMFETVQGEGGVNPLDNDFVLEIDRLCKENDMLTVVDEVQTGNGRTGKLYGYMNYGITPDIVTTAKGLGGGLPIGATMLGEKVEDIFAPGMHGSTFGGNPVCCAGAVSIIERLDDALLDEVVKKSEYIKSELIGASGIKSVSGMGLMLGIETEKDAKEIVNKCLEMGVLVLTAKSKVRLLPPLNIDFELLKKAIAILKEACKA